MNVSRSWKEGRARFDSDFSASINEDTTFEELKALYVEELSLVGSVHLLKQVQTGSDEVIDRLKAAFDERQSLRNMPDTVIGRVVQDASINAFAIDHRLENPTVKDIFVELPVIAQSNVGDFDASDYDQNVKVMDVKHTSQKTLGITSSEFEALGRDSYMMTSILENLADKGYDRLVVSGGNGASVFVPSVKGTNALAPENVEILARGMQVPDEQNLVIKSQDKKVLFMSSDAPVEFNSISIDMLTTYIENGEPELLLVPPITAQKGAVYDSLNAIINELEKVPETKAETGLSIGGYPDMPSVLRKAGATVTHVHISHEDGHLSPYFDEHVKGADMEIKVKSDQNLNDLMKSKAVEINALVQSNAPAVDKTLSFDEANELIRGYEDLFDLERSPICSWNGREVHRVTPELIDDVVSSITGKTPQEAFEALFSYSDEASEYAVKFAKDKLDTELKLPTTPIEVKPKRENVEPGQQRKMQF